MSLTTMLHPLSRADSPSPHRLRFSAWNWPPSAKPQAISFSESSRTSKTQVVGSAICLGFDLNSKRRRLWLRIKRKPQRCPYKKRLWKAGASADLANHGGVQFELSLPSGSKSVGLTNDPVGGAGQYSPVGAGCLPRRPQRNPRTAEPGFTLLGRP